MARSGFIFSPGRCVACGACKAGCFIENGWSLNPRQLFVLSRETATECLVTNLSMACNHCETAICMEGCPASCYSRDKLTGSVIIDDEKCLGCKYCTWVCPYDAPKFDSERKTILKCNLCINRLKEIVNPACSEACPTGALKYGEISGDTEETFLKWIPTKGLKPGFEFTGNYKESTVRIIPDNLFVTENNDQGNDRIGIKGNLSLLIFSFFSMISVSYLACSLLKGVFPSVTIYLAMVFISWFSTLFHLGKWTRAWRSVLNIRKSPLSREIIFFMIYSGLSVAAVFLRLPFLLISSVVAGFIFLIAIDNVYLFADRRRKVLLHSGQTFISSLIVISFFSGMLIPFLLIALLKLLSSVYTMIRLRESFPRLELRFSRFSLLLISGAGLLSGITNLNLVLLSVFITGELLDRILFYIEFSPSNIKSSIINHLNSKRNEKERGQ